MDREREREIRVDGRGGGSAFGRIECVRKQIHSERAGPGHLEGVDRKAHLRPFLLCVCVCACVDGCSVACVESNDRDFARASSSGDPGLFPMLIR